MSVGPIESFRSRKVAWPCAVGLAAAGFLCATVTFAAPDKQPLIGDKAVMPSPASGTARAITILHGVPGSGEKGSAAEFSGTVYRSSSYTMAQPGHVRGSLVSFEPGARTAWHRHPMGQTLIVVSGVGWVQMEGAAVAEVRPGDIVIVPPNVRHWHGATPSSAMSHVSVTEARPDGTSVEWMEAVPEAVYRRGPAKD